MQAATGSNDFVWGRAEKDRVGLLCKRFWSQGLKGQRDQAGQAWEHGANGRAGGFFRCDCDQFKMRMERDQADELRSGITAGACDGNANFSHSSVVIAVDIKKGKAGRLPFLSCGSGVLSFGVLEPLSGALLSVLLALFDS